MSRLPLETSTIEYIAMCELPVARLQQVLFEQRDNRLNLEAWKLAGNEYPKAETSAILTPTAEKSGLSQLEIQRTIDSAYNAPNPYKHKSKLAAWQLAELYVNTHGILKTTAQKSVFSAFQTRARIGTHGNIFRLTEREGMELADVSSSTFRKARNYLAAQKVIILAGTDKRCGGQLYRFGHFPKAQHLESDALDTTCLTMEESSASNLRSKLNTVEVLRNAHTDAIARGALGHTGYLVYRAIDPKMPLSIEQIAAAIDVKPKTVANYLAPKKWLRSTGLVKLVPGGYIADVVSDAELDARIAAPAGTLGAGEARKQRHIAQRAKRATYFAMKHRWTQDPEYRAALAAMYPIYQHELDYDVVQKLIARGTPESAVNEVIHLQSTGVNVTAKMATAIIQRHKDEQPPTPPTPPKSNIDLPAPHLLKCPNCGQLIAAAFGAPDMCDYCKDLTTWKPTEPPASNGNREMAIQKLFVNGLSPQPIDSLVQFGVDELGGVLDTRPPTPRKAQSAAMQSVEVELSPRSDKPTPTLAQLADQLKMRRGALSQRRYFTDKQQVQRAIAQHDAWIKAGDVTAIQMYLADTQHLKGRAH